ncbi:hypothetical protein [Streptomyces sp. WAC06614]|uniref:hypothetical protein n=1 Tax=Streptomyces sp. WAC06614 TaxID=2487416 RepID=UPI000F7A60BE|nr:hypothetical protein [Streptomyces sp. WAC06614]RSS64728.1 hypothetical protein EF918_30280 [Streptomyces sp. WAC06614]
MRTPRAFSTAALTAVGALALAGVAPAAQAAQHSGPAAAAPASAPAKPETHRTTPADGLNEKLVGGPKAAFVPQTPVKRVGYDDPSATKRRVGYDDPSATKKRVAAPTDGRFGKTDTTTGGAPAGFSA